MGCFDNTLENRPCVCEHKVFKLADQTQLSGRVLIADNLQGVGVTTIFAIADVD